MTETETRTIAAATVRQGGFSSHILPSPVQYEAPLARGPVFLIVAESTIGPDDLFEILVANNDEDFVSIGQADLRSSLAAYVFWWPVGDSDEWNSQEAAILEELDNVERGTFLGQPITDPFDVKAVTRVSSQSPDSLDKVSLKLKSIEAWPDPNSINRFSILYGFLNGPRASGGLSGLHGVDIVINNVWFHQWVPLP